MVRHAMIVLGALLALVIASLATPPGHALLGFRSTDRAQPITVIKDQPHVAPLQPPAPHPAAHPLARQGVPDLGQVLRKFLTLPQLVLQGPRHQSDDH